MQGYRMNYSPMGIVRNGRILMGGWYKVSMRLSVFEGVCYRSTHTDITHQ